MKTFHHKKTFLWKCSFAGEVQNTLVEDFHPLFASNYVSLTVCHYVHTSVHLIYGLLVVLLPEIDNV